MREVMTCEAASKIENETMLTQAVGSVVWLCAALTELSSRLGKPGSHKLIAKAALPNRDGLERIQNFVSMKTRLELLQEIMRDSERY